MVLFVFRIVQPLDADAGCGLSGLQNPLEQVCVGCPAGRFILDKGCAEGCLSVCNAEAANAVGFDGTEHALFEIRCRRGWVLRNRRDEALFDVKHVVIQHAVDEVLLAVDHPQKVGQLTDRPVFNRHRDIHLGNPEGFGVFWDLFGIIRGFSDGFRFRLGVQPAMFDQHGLNGFDHRFILAVNGAVTIDGDGTDLECRRGHAHVGRRQFGQFRNCLDHILAVFRVRVQVHGEASFVLWGMPYITLKP